MFCFLNEIIVVIWFMLIELIIVFGFYIVFMYFGINIRVVGGIVEVKKINGIDLGDKFFYVWFYWY